MRQAIAFSLLLICATAEAGVVYHYRHTSDNPMMVSSASKEWIDGERRRIDRSEGDPVFITRDLEISEDGGATWIYVNRRLETWYRSDDPGLVHPDAFERPSSSPLFTIPVRADRESFDRIRIEEIAAVEGGEIAGHRTMRHEIRFSYRIRARFQDSPLEARVNCTIVSWTAEGVPPPTLLPVRSSVESIDRMIEQWRQGAASAILRRDVSITRTISGGKPFHHNVRFLVEELDEVPIDPARFVIPPGLEHRLPVVGAPGS